MIKKNDNRVWLYSKIAKRYYLLGAGLTRLEEVCKTALLETPNIHSPLCKREILYHTGQLEFEGIVTLDTAMDILLAAYMKRGNDALVPLIIASRQEAISNSFVRAKRLKGYICIENSGSGEGPLGSRIKGKIVYAETPEVGFFDETTQSFSPHL